MSRFYVKPEDVRGSEILVSKEEAHHIIDVMRLTVGDNVVAFDGSGKEYTGKIKAVDKNGVMVRITSVKKARQDKDINITIVQGLPKREIMDYVVEKVTELGVDRIIPVIVERTVVRYDEDKARQKVSHWKNIAISASKQCGRVKIPDIRPITTLAEVLKDIKNYDLVIMACLSGHTVPLKKAISGSKAKEILVLVGPEGDFSPKEIEAARSSGVRLVSLGDMVLRVETAAIYIMSVLNYEGSV